jgi:glycosyltransferase involved in cell wall biosynthesis
MAMARDFKIHCIALTKNEADVVGLCLREAAKWADFIYVYDGASTDGTWDIVKSLESKTIIPWKQHGKVFREGLRAEVFEHFRHNSAPGDWWVRLDVDEFYPESPREFFARVGRAYDFVWGITVDYVLTESDIAEFDFSVPFESNRPRIRHYKVTWSEPRAFRYRPRLVWMPTWSWPRHAGLIAPERIVFKHYPLRSPSQIQMRLDIRRENRARGFEGWEHANHASWREKIVDEADCMLDDGKAPLAIDAGRLPRHLEPPLVRLTKRVLHGTGVWP